MANVFGCMEVIDDLESSSLMQEGGRSRLEQIEESMGGEPLEMVSVKGIGNGSS